MVQSSVIRDQILKYFDINNIDDIPVDLLILLNESNKKNISWADRIEQLKSPDNKLFRVYNFKRHALFSYLKYLFNVEINDTAEEKILIGDFANGVSLLKQELLKYFDINSIDDVPIDLLSLISDCKKNNHIWNVCVEELFLKSEVGAYCALNILNLILHIEHIFDIVINDDESEYLITLGDLIKKIQEKLNQKSI